MGVIEELVAGRVGNLATGRRVVEPAEIPVLVRDGHRALVSLAEEKNRPLVNHPRLTIDLTAEAVVVTIAKAANEGQLGNAGFLPQLPERRLTLGFARFLAALGKVPVPPAVVEK